MQGNLGLRPLTANVLHYTYTSIARRAPRGYDCCCSQFSNVTEFSNFVCREVSNFREVLAHDVITCFPFFIVACFPFFIGPMYMNTVTENMNTNDLGKR